MRGKTAGKRQGEKDREIEKEKNREDTESDRQREKGKKQVQEDKRKDGDQTNKTDRHTKTLTGERPRRKKWDLESEVSTRQEAREGQRDPERKADRDGGGPRYRAAGRRRPPRLSCGGWRVETG